MGTETHSRPADFGAIQLPRRLGLAGWQFHLARRASLIRRPICPQVAGRLRWSTTWPVASTRYWPWLARSRRSGRPDPPGAWPSAPASTLGAGDVFHGAWSAKTCGNWPAGAAWCRSTSSSTTGATNTTLYRPADLDRIAAERSELLAGVLAERLPGSR